MAPEIKRILYATDLSENARYAFGYAADLASRYDASITILYVMESMNHVAELHIQEMMGKENWDKLKAEQLEKSKATIKERVSAFCSEMDNKLDSCDFMVDDIRITSGVPCLEILKTADKVNADLIIIGKHGYNILESSLIGGTARRVVKDSELPVMVIRLPE